MGNKVNTISPTECIRDLISGNISFQKCSCEEIATHLDIVIFLGTNIANGEIEITSKQLPDLIQVYGVIIKMIDDLHSSQVLNEKLFSKECLKKALNALLRLLVIPQISKKVFENSFLSITNHLEINQVEIFPLAFLTFFNGFRHVEGPLSQVSLRTVGPEENIRQQICLQLEKHDLFQIFLTFLLQTSARLSSESQVVTSILIFRLLSWILTRTSSSTNQLRIKLRYLLLQHQETLFELLRHDDAILSDASAGIMILLLRQEERGTCVALQETSRTYGVLLWALARMTNYQIQIKKGSVSDEEGESKDVKFIDPNFLPPLEEPQAMNALEHLKILLTQLVVGNKTNAEVILSAYPTCFQELLTPSSPFFIHQLSKYIHITDDSPFLPLQLYLEKLSGSNLSPGEKNSFAFSPNWYVMLTTLMSDIELPLLVWNIDTLEFLLKELRSLEESLDFARQLRHEAWDSRYLDVNYSAFYFSHYHYAVICDIFIHRIIDVLELGRTEFIRSPLSFSWGLIENITLCRVSRITFGEMPVPGSVSNQYNCGEGIVDGKDLFLLRTLHLLYLRYQEELSQIPMSSLCQLLRYGIIQQQQQQSTGDPQWIHHCVNILSIRLHNSSQKMLSACVTSGCVDVLLFLLSSFPIMESLLRYQEESDEIFDSDSEGEESKDHHDLGEGTVGGGGGVSQPQPCNPTDVKILSRKGSIHRSRRSSQVNTSHVVNRLQTGESVVVNMTTLLFTLCHESNCCSNYLGLASSPALTASATVTEGSLNPSSALEKLLRAVWLISCHGPNRPQSANIALEKLLYAILRVLHASPITLYPSLLSETQILRIILASGVTPTGDGILLPAAVELLSDILLSIPFYIPSQSSSDTTTADTVHEESIKLAKEALKNRLSLRQVILTENFPSTGAAAEGSSPAMASNKFLNLLGSDVIMNYSSPSLSQATLQQPPAAVAAPALYLPPVLDEITSIIPYQLVIFLSQLPSHAFCSQVFNAPNILKPDIIWNKTLRQDLIVSLYRELSPWHLSAFGQPLGLTDIVTPSPMKYGTLRCEPQLSGIYLVHLLNIKSPLEFLNSSFDVRAFAKDILKTLQGSIGMVRRNSLSSSSLLSKQGTSVTTSTRRDSKTLFESKNSHLGYNESFFELVPEKQSGYLLLSLRKLIEILNFPEDVWYDDALPTLSNLIDFYSRRANEGLSLTPSAAAAALSSLELGMEAYLCCLLCLLQSLFPTNFMRDETKKLLNSQQSIRRIFLNFRMDNFGSYGPLFLHKQCHSILFSMKLSLQYWTSTQAKHVSLDQYFSLSLSLSSLFLLQLSLHCYETIYPTSESDSAISLREERKSIGRSSLTFDDLSSISSPPPNGIPSEVLLCLRNLMESNLFDDLFCCFHRNIATGPHSSPYATLHSILALRFFILMKTEYQPQLLDLIVSRGVILHLLELITTLLTADDDSCNVNGETGGGVSSYTAKELTYGFHPSLISYDKFSEKVPLPLNRRRGSAASASVSVQAPDSPRPRANSAGNIFSLATHGSPDLAYYSNLDDACRDFLRRATTLMTSSVISSSSFSPGQQEPTHPSAPSPAAPVPASALLPLSVVPDITSLHKLIIYEATLLIRTIVSVATVLLKSSPATPTWTGTTSPSTSPFSFASSANSSNASSSSPSISSSQVILSLLDYILTPSLHHILLNNLSLFLEILRSQKSVKRPLAIWNPSMLTLLRGYLRTEILKIEATQLDSDTDAAHDHGHCVSYYSLPSNLLEKDSFKSLYPMLSEEILIDGVFISLLLDPQNRDDIGARNLSVFVEQLQASVTSNKRVLELVQQQQQQQQQRRQSIISKTALVSQLAIKQQVLNHILREHPELGYSDLYVAD